MARPHKDFGRSTLLKIHKHPGHINANSQYQSKGAFRLSLQPSFTNIAFNPKSPTNISMHPSFVINPASPFSLTFVLMGNH